MIVLCHVSRGRIKPICGPMLILTGGWEDWLCCASNEICYTAPNLEAACSPTASPVDATTRTITIPLIVLTSLVRQTRVTTETSVLSETAHQAHRTSLVTLTSVETSTVLYTSPQSKPTRIGSKNGTLTPSEAEKQEGLTATQKMVIGIAVPVGIVLIAGIAFGCWWTRRTPKQTKDISQDGDEMDSFGPQNFGHAQNRSPMHDEEINRYPNLQPRESAMLSGPDNPYNQDDRAAPYPRPASAASYYGPEPPGPEGRAVPPRRPVRGMPATAEEDNRYGY